MTKRLIRMLVAWLLLGTVLVVCVAPGVDLPESALRAKQIATLFFWLLTAALFVLVQPIRIAPRWTLVRISQSPPRLLPTLPYSTELVDVTCARLI